MPMHGSAASCATPRSASTAKRARLLDHVDVITSVSGGSFTAAYYGLFGDRIFTDYEPRFLRRNIQRQLILEVLNLDAGRRLLRESPDYQRLLAALNGGSS